MMLPTKREAAAELLRRREARRNLAAYINFTNRKYKQSGFSAAVCAALDMFIHATRRYGKRATEKVIHGEAGEQRAAKAYMERRFGSDRAS